jgi:type II secretory pathway pseudopilin PulG
MNGNSRKAKRQHGFTIMQMVVTVAIISIVSTVGVLGVKSSREHFKMQNSARLFASYAEKARADSVRRHAGSGQEASVEMFGEGTNTYNVTMDFGSGVETRTFQLDPGITFGTAPAKVTFDWRGRLLGEAVVFQIQSKYLDDEIPVDVSGSGDVTIWSQHYPDKLIPDVNNSTVSDDVDHSTPTPTATATPSPTASPSPSDGASPSPTPTPTPTATPNGNGNGNGNGSNNGNNGNGNGNASPTPTPTATPTPSPSPSATPIPQCVSVMSPSSISLSQSNDAHKSGTSTFTMTNATGVRIISASQAGNGNSLVLGLSLSRIDGSGSSVLTVTSKNGAGNRGVFNVNVTTDPACGSGAQLTVSVSN